VHLDLTRQSDTEGFFSEERPEYVFLAAAKVGGILANNTYKADFICDNLAIASNVISSAYKYGVRKLLNFGSSCIYPKLAPQPMKEEYLLAGPLEPTNEPYAIAKIAAIKLCRYFNEQHGTSFLSAVPAGLYGPNDNFNLETAHVLPALLRKFHLGKLLRQGRLDLIREELERYRLGFGLDDEIKPGDSTSPVACLERLGVTADHVTLWGSGEPYREFMHVDDLADAALFLLANSEYRQVGEFVNIGTGHEIRLRDLASVVQGVVGFDGKILYDLSKQDGMSRKLLDISLCAKLSWRARISFEDGIRDTYYWYLAALREGDNSSWTDGPRINHAPSR
jgi:GDP-L-fucose synthase